MPEVLKLDPGNSKTTGISRVGRVWVEHSAWLLTKNIGSEERASRRASLLFAVRVRPYDVYELPDGECIPASPESEDRVLLSWMNHARGLERKEAAS